MAHIFKGEKKNQLYTKLVKNWSIAIWQDLAPNRMDCLAKSWLAPLDDIYHKQCTQPNASLNSIDCHSEFQGKFY